MQTMRDVDITALPGHRGVAAEHQLRLHANRAVTVRELQAVSLAAGWAEGREPVPRE